MSSSDEAGPAPTLDGGPLVSSLAPSGSGTTGPLVAGRYEILALLGAGGMGTVYRARDLELDEIVALKVLRKDAVTSASLERFRREVKLARRVTHKNVARTFDIGEHQGERFLTMELVEGQSLTALGRAGALPVARVMEILSGVCDGLAAAHAAGVVHRDLKPDNVLVAPDGRVVITDFGIARSQDVGTATLGAVVGTPAYMAPEQVQGTEVDARADLYSLGVMAFELLTGQLPFHGDSVFALAIARLQGEAPDPRTVRPELPTGLAELVRRLLARDPARRPASASEVAASLATVTTPAAIDQVVRLVRATPQGGLGTQASASTGGAAGPKTVAVLPFANQGPVEETWLAEGIAQDIADTLSTTRGLRVRAALSSRFQGEIDARAVGAELGVQVLVVGSVRRLGARARVSARAVSTADGFQIWAGRFDRDAGELLVVSDEVAHEVARALTVELREADPRVVLDPAAIDEYLRGRRLVAAETEVSSIREGVRLLEQARARAPEDAAILSYVALGYARLWFGGDASAATPAREAAERAIAIAPSRGEPLLARGMIAYQMGDFPPAIRDLKRALHLAPSMPEAHHLLGSLQLEIGPPELGARRLRTALLLEPHQLRSVVELSRYHALHGDFDEAFAVLDRFVGEGGSAAWIPRARICLWEGKPERIAATRAAAEAAGASAVGLMFDLADSKDEKAMEALLDASPVGGLARASIRGRALRSQGLAEMTSLVGRPERSIRHLRDAVEAELVDLTWMEICPALRVTRERPEFPELLEAVRRRAHALRAVLES